MWVWGALEDRKSTGSLRLRLEKMSWIQKGSYQLSPLFNTNIFTNHLVLGTIFIMYHLVFIAILQGRVLPYKYIEVQREHNHMDLNWNISRSDSKVHALSLYQLSLLTLSDKIIMVGTHIWYLLCARNCTNHFTFISSFTLYNKPRRWVLLLPSTDKELKPREIQQKHSLGFNLGLIWGPNLLISPWCLCCVEVSELRSQNPGTKYTTIFLDEASNRSENSPFFPQVLSPSRIS